ncbi:hypothetical protein DPV78_012720, partial [Talaromyces pinophilus]
YISFLAESILNSRRKTKSKDNIFNKRIIISPTNEVNRATSLLCEDIRIFKQWITEENKDS